MSGPKIVRVVTREELVATSRSHIRGVEEAFDVFIHMTKRFDFDDSEIHESIGARLRDLEGLFGAERWTDVQKQALQTVAFLRSEVERIRNEAVAASATIVSKRRRLVDSARSLVDAYANSGSTVPESLAHVVAKAMIIEEKELPAYQGAVDQAFQALLTSTEVSHTRTDRIEFAGRLGEGEATITLTEWLAARPKTCSVQDNRLDTLLAESNVFSDPIYAAALFEKAARITTERSPSQRALLTDSLIMEASEQMKLQRQVDKVMARLRDARVRLSAVALPTARKIEAALSAALAAEDSTNVDELVAQACAVADRETQLTVSAARRKAVLSGLAALGYEVHESMQTAWADDGRLIVKKPGRSDYGVELGAPPDASRLQLRLVGAEAPTAPRTSSRDKDEETMWCGEFQRLRDIVASQGGSIEIERAVAAGAQTVKSAAFSPADEHDRTHARSERNLHRY